MKNVEIMDADYIIEVQKRICRSFVADYSPLPDDARVGVAMETVDLIPLYGVRLEPQGNMCGWWIHGGEWSDAEDFYSPLCMMHIPRTCKFAVPFLALPVGWRFYTDGKGDFHAWLQFEDE